jgi:hypothetical protein
MRSSTMCLLAVRIRKIGEEERVGWERKRGEKVRKNSLKT